MSIARGAIRDWIQWTFINGSSVTWNSNEQLRSTRGITPRMFEELADKIDAAEKSANGGDEGRRV